MTTLTSRCLVIMTIPKDAKSSFLPKWKYPRKKRQDESMGKCDQ
jgi:hypothetical protein